MSARQADFGPIPTSPLARMAYSLRRLPVFRSDVLIVGSGVAGLATALAAADKGAHVMVLCKGRVHETNTYYAQGGIAAAMSREDDPELHAADTVRLGYGLSDQQVVETITDGAPEAMNWLLESGMSFDRDPSGELSLGMEGGHRLPRILHSGGTATGKELQRVLIARARQHPNIDIYEGTAAVELLKDAEGTVTGLVALARRGASGGFDPVLFEADSVVLATGGGGQIFRETTNPQLATADGLAMALRAGVSVRDLEFVQFHPTILYLAGAARFLISEVVRGEGAVLRDRNGNAFMADAHADADLAPRDIVSRAIFRRMVEIGDTHVYLDLSAVSDPSKRFPALARIAAEFGISLEKDLIPVRPAVHYFVGGVATDLTGKTSVDGLFAVGECASTAFHGANRMGSNSLLEGLVHGRMVGERLLDRPRNVRRFLSPHFPEEHRMPAAELHLADMTYSLKSLMWRQVGIERDAAGLTDARERLDAWAGYLARLGPFTPEGVEVMNMVHVAQAITASAIFREESRGAHFRSDFPNTMESWRVHTRLQSDGNRLRISAQPVPGYTASILPSSHDA
ncbi:MAG: L-aspartate oxidase [Planctomycetota bacterium]